MNILINCSNLKAGGGLQVGDSICKSLRSIEAHKFIVVLSSFMEETARNLKGSPNLIVEQYDIKNRFSTLIFGRDKVLDELVKKYNVDCVLTVFGPSRWDPKVPHLSGFARAQLIMPNSPYYKQMPFLKFVKSNLINQIWNWYFKRSSKYFYTENPLTSKLLQDKWTTKKIYTVTNYYNQVFDEPLDPQLKESDNFDGCNLLMVTSAGEWKNIQITRKIAKILNSQHPDFRFRFIITVDRKSFGLIEEDIAEHFELLGTVDNSRIPYLYHRADIMFQPTLLECFTATYPEAMRMGVPIVTTDLDFAKGLCEDAALYYSPLDAQAAADAIYNVATNKVLRDRLIEKGSHQLLKFNSYNERARKLIELCESIGKGII